MRSRALMKGTPIMKMLLTAASLWLCCSGPTLGQVPKEFETHLYEGRLADAERVVAEPANDDARFALGVVRFIRAVEARAQAFHRHGYRANSMLGQVFPATNLPIPANSRPEPIDAAKFRSMLEQWVKDLDRVETTLAAISSKEVKLKLRFGLVKVDLDGDGRSGPDESLWKIYQRFNRAANVTAEGAEGFSIAFDRGDVEWL